MAKDPGFYKEEFPLVSVIVPCYNVADYVSAALESVFNQSYKNWEIICVDDGSSDETISVIKKWHSSHEGARLSLIQQNNNGACAARNRGMEKAGGLFIQFLDADDVLLPQKIGHQVAILKHQPEVSFVIGGYVRCKTDGARQQIEVKSAELLDVYYGLAGITSSNFFRKSDLDKVNGWNDQLKSSQEADLMFRLLLRAGTGAVDDAIHTEIHERKSGQISKGDPVKRLRNYLAVRTSMIDAVKNWNPEEWKINQKFYESFLVSTLLVLNRYEPGAWRNYRSYLPRESDLVVLAGLSKRNLRMIRLLGYASFFRLTKSLKAKQI